jgi:hypothetical protein
MIKTDGSSKGIYKKLDNLEIENIYLMGLNAELLEACKGLLNLIRADKHMDIYFKAQEAINKAEGRRDK